MRVDLFPSTCSGKKRFLFDDAATGVRTLGHGAAIEPEAWDGDVAVTYGLPVENSRFYARRREVVERYGERVAVLDAPFFPLGGFDPGPGQWWHVHELYALGWLEATPCPGWRLRLPEEPALEEVAPELTRASEVFRWDPFPRRSHACRPALYADSTAADHRTLQHPPDYTARVLVALRNRVGLNGVRYRPHPPASVENLPMSVAAMVWSDAAIGLSNEVTCDEAIEASDLVVSDGTPALHALYRGVDALVTSPQLPGFQVAPWPDLGADPLRVRLPNRHERRVFFARLALTQFYRYELRDGTAWRSLCD